MNEPHWIEHTKPRDWLNALMFIPAVLAWAAFGLAILLGPHLAAEPEPLMWAFYAAAGWYLVLLTLFGGWLGLILLAAAH